MKVDGRRSFCRKEFGESLVSVLAGLALASLLMTAAVSNFVGASRLAKDHEMINKTEAEARTLLDLIAFDIRLTGSGMPLGQANFSLSDASLGSAPLPVLTSSTSNTVSIRLNQQGYSSVLSSDYTPSASSLTLSLPSTTGFAAGNSLYISDLSVGGTAGLYGTVSSVSPSSLILNTNPVYTSSTTFKAGSLVNKVDTVTYSTSGSYQGIYRSEGATNVLLSPDSEFTASYLDSSGTSLVLPLTASVIQNSLSALRISILVRSHSRLSEGQYYFAQASQTIALRNLNVLR